VRRADRGRRRAGRGSQRDNRRAWVPLALGGVAIVAVVVVVGAVMGWLPTGTPDPPDPNATATPLANPPAEPAGDGTQVTIETELGSIVMEIYTQSSPVAASNFVTLAESGFYDGVVFHRIVPGFVIQGGDPEGTGRGGPGYTIADEPVVGEYVRGTVAMARTPAPNSQGSQFFVVLDDAVQFQLDKAGGYAIFGRVIEGMDVVDQIAAGPASQQMALEPVAMTRVTVQRP
jgi:peptidyl-prolyl cis-trans isomerase B (cyclophilin B)